MLSWLPSYGAHFLSYGSAQYPTPLLSMTEVALFRHYPAVAALSYPCLLFILLYNPRPPPSLSLPHHLVQSSG